VIDRIDPARYLMLLRRQDSNGKVIFDSTLDREVRNLDDIRQLLQRNQISPLTFERDRNWQRKLRYRRVGDSG